MSQAKSFSARRLSLDAMMLAASMLLSYLEGLLPLHFLPGAHLGLSHIPVMLLFVKGHRADAAVVSLLRLCTVTLFFGGVTAFFFALCGSTLSFLALLLFFRNSGRIGLSMASASFHASGQIFAALLIYRTQGLLFTYYPLLLLLSIPTGALSGLLLYLIETKGARLFENRTL